MSIYSTLTQLTQNCPAKPALLADGRLPLSYRDLQAQVNQIATKLRAMGIGPQDLVAITLPNGPEMAVVCLGVMSTAIAVPANPDYREVEYAEMFSRLKPCLLITLAGIDHPSKSAARASGLQLCELEVVAGAPAGSCILKGMPTTAMHLQAALPSPAVSDVALILQTSGTTSLPKIVPLTHGNLIASATNLQQSLQLDSSDCVLHFLPMFHIGGIVDVLLAPLLAGGSVVCCKSFATPDFFRDLLQFKPTWVQAVPIMIQEILSVKDDYSVALSTHTLKFLRSVSAPLSVSLMQTFEEKFRIPVIEIFGMTETAGVITSNPLPPLVRKPGSVGIPFGCEVNILDDAGAVLPFTKLGQVSVRGDNVMSGYQNDAEANAQTRIGDALYTGDIGYFDAEGYLYLAGRIKDIINRGGEKLSPLEVDRVLMSHPSLADAACYPVPHQSLGEEVAAIVVMKNDLPFDREALMAFLRERLAYFKIPRSLQAVNVIPRNNGKLQRAKLADQFKADFETYGSAASKFEAPQSPVAKMIAESWEKILKLDAIGIHDDFFNIGGDSLKAASFINDMQQKWGETIYVSSLFDAPTISSYEQFLRQHYPEVLARMLGSFVAPKQDDTPPVTAEMIATLRATIAHPAPSSRPAAKKNPRAIFVLSAPRSGSTLLRVMLAGNPKLFSPPELYLLSFDTMADRKTWYSGSQRFQLEGNIRALQELRNEPLEDIQKFIAALEEQNCTVQEYYRMIQEWLGDRILTDKTPAYAIDIETLQRAEDCFEDPYYIHLVRHPYGMIRSFEEAKLEQLWYPRLVGDKISGLDALPYKRKQLAEMVWFILNENILKFLENIPTHRQTNLRFEDMVSQPEKEMRLLCEKIGLEYEPGMVNPQQEKKNRMTDGIHQSSRMIGDPKFHQHSKIDPAIADQWKSVYESDFLAEPSLGLARTLGYEDTVASVLGRTELDL